MMNFLLSLVLLLGLYSHLYISSQAPALSQYSVTKYIQLAPISLLLLSQEKELTMYT